MKSKVRFVFYYVALAFLPITGFAQEGKFAIGLYSSIDFNNYKLRGNLPYVVENRIKNSTGLNFYFGLGKSFELKTGLLYSGKGYALKFDPSLLNETNEKGYITDKAAHSQQNLDIPIIIGYRLINKERFSLTPGLGTVFGFRLSGSSEFTMPDGTVQETGGGSIAKPHPISPIMEIRLGYKLSEKVVLGVNPYYRHYFDYSDQKAVVPKSNTFGIGFDVRYIIK